MLTDDISSWRLMYCSCSSCCNHKFLCRVVCNQLCSLRSAMQSWHFLRWCHISTFFTEGAGRWTHNWMECQEPNESHYRWWPNPWSKWWSAFARGRVWLQKWFFDQTPTKTVWICPPSRPKDSCIFLIKELCQHIFLSHAVLMLPWQPWKLTAMTALCSGDGWQAWDLHFMSISSFHHLSTCWSQDQCAALPEDCGLCTSDLSNLSTCSGSRPKRKCHCWFYTTVRTGKQLGKDSWKDS